MTQVSLVADAQHRSTTELDPPPERCIKVRRASSRIRSTIDPSVGPAAAARLLHASASWGCILFPRRRDMVAKDANDCNVILCPDVGAERLRNHEERLPEILECAN